MALLATFWFLYYAQFRVNSVLLSLCVSWAIHSGNALFIVSTNQCVSSIHMASSSDYVKKNDGYCT